MSCGGKKCCLIGARGSRTSRRTRARHKRHNARRVARPRIARANPSRGSNRPLEPSAPVYVRVCVRPVYVCTRGVASSVNPRRLRFRRSRSQLIRAWRLVSARYSAPIYTVPRNTALRYTGDDKEARGSRLSEECPRGMRVRCARGCTAG